MIQLQLLNNAHFFLLDEQNDLLSRLREHMKGIEFPTKQDVSGSVHSLFSIQYTYRIPVAKLAKGILGTRKTFAVLTAQDIKEIVRNRMNDSKSITNYAQKDYALSIEWIDGAIRYTIFMFWGQRRHIIKPCLGI